MAYWLFKSEPNVFNLDDLRNRPSQTEHWDGVRNYQARNMLRDQVKVNDDVLFYYSNCDEPGIAGIAKVVKAGYPDTTAFNPTSKYYDPKSTKANPRWFMVDVRFVRKFPKIISLQQLKKHPKLDKMLVARKGNRLSITPVTDEEWKIILTMI